MSHPKLRWAGVAAALAACVSVAAIAATTGSAQTAGATYTITYGKSGGALDDLRPKGIERGRISLGDQFFVSTQIRRQDGVRGTLSVTYTATDRRPVRADRSHGTLVGEYRFPDGSLLFLAGITFDDSDTDSGVIVGGTRAYAGARGTIESDAKRDVIRLDP